MFPYRYIHNYVWKHIMYIIIYEYYTYTHIMYLKAHMHIYRDFLTGEGDIDIGHEEWAPATSKVVPEDVCKLQFTYSREFHYRYLYVFIYVYDLCV